MFIAAQFPTAKCWNQPKCPSANEWIKKHHVILHAVYLTSLSTMSFNRLVFDCRPVLARVVGFEFWLYPLVIFVPSLPICKMKTIMVFTYLYAYQVSSREENQ